jgi:hypothetical protein
MSLPFIAYCNGAGGHWLSHLLRAIETGHREFPPVSGINFHPGGRTSYFKIAHNDTGAPADYTFGALCRFDLFINAWLKFRCAYNYLNFNALDPGQQIHVLSNDVRWRWGPVYAGAYESKLDLDYALLFGDTEKFRDQLLTILNQHWPQHYITAVTQSYIDSAADAFRATVPPAQDHLGNVDSQGWRGWCDALCLLNGVIIPVDIAKDPASYSAWLTDNQAWIIDKTLPFVL